MIQDAESVRSGHSHVASQPVSFPPHPVPGGMLSRSLGMPSRKNGPPRIWDTHGISGNVFANPAASSSAPYPQELNPWSSQKSEQIHSSLVREILQRILEQTNNDCRCEIFILTNSLHQQRLLAGRKDSRLRYVIVHKFLRKLCCGSKKWRWWPGGWGPQGMSGKGGGGLARVPNLHVCKHPYPLRGGTRRGGRAN